MSKTTLGALLACVTFLACSAAAEPLKVVTLVTIQGATFKVRTRGDEATVARQSVYINANTEHYMKAKRAAEIASGCVATDSFPVMDLLNVKLDCSRRSATVEAGEMVVVKGLSK